MKLFSELVARALAAQTQLDWDTLCTDVVTCFTQGKITYEEHDLLFTLIERLSQ